MLVYKQERGAVPSHYCGTSTSRQTTTFIPGTTSTCRQIVIRTLCATLRRSQMTSTCRQSEKAYIPFSFFFSSSIRKVDVSTKHPDKVSLLILKEISATSRSGVREHGPCRQLLHLQGGVWQGRPGQKRRRPKALWRPGWGWPQHR